MDSMRTIIVMHCFSYIYDGGQETFILKTFKYIKQNSSRRFLFIIVSLVDEQNPKLVKAYEDAGIKLIRLNFKNRNLGLIDLYANLKQLLKLSNEVRREKVDILYGHDFFSAFIVRVTYLLCFLKGYRIRKLYISLHNLLFWLKPTHHLINRFLALFTDKIICVSQSLFKFSLNTDKINLNKYEVIYNGIDTEEYKYDLINRNELRKEYGISENTFVFGAIGSISFRKGHLFLIKAFKKFQETHPDSLLVIFGGYREIDGDLEIKSEVENYITLHKLNERIRILKPRLDIKKAYSMFDVYVMPSVVEGFGLSLVEAMSCESIIIASDIPPFMEILEDNHNALLFKSQDVSDLESKLYETYELSTARKLTMGKNARLSVVEKFNSKLMGENYARLYELS